MVADAALARLAACNRRTLDVIAARIYFYYSYAHEAAGQLDSIRRWGRAGAEGRVLGWEWGGVRCARTVAALGGERGSRLSWLSWVQQLHGFRTEARYHCCSS